MKTLAVAFAVPLATLALAMAPAHAATTLSLLDGVVGSTPLTSVSSGGPGAIALDAAGAGGVFVSGLAVSQIGINRLYVANSTGLPFADTATTISGLSFWADNLMVTSGNSNPVHLSISFSFEGDYTGPCCEAPNPSSTFGNAYFLAAPGQFLNIGQASEGGPVNIETSLGAATLQGQNTAVPGGVLSVAGLCPEDDGEDGCDPFSVSTIHTLDFFANPGEDFWLAGYFFVGDLAQGEMVDAFHTARLVGIEIDAGARLLSESGQIVQRDDGSYGLAAPVPEPATWAMMITGFGMVGGAMRRRDARQWRRI